MEQLNSLRHLLGPRPPSVPAPELMRLYPGDLSGLRSGRVIANFVATLDSVIAFEDAQRGASAVSLNASADHLVMGLLRSLCDVLVIGAQTFRSGLHAWSPHAILPDHIELLDDVRLHHVGALAPPPLAVVSRSGSLPADHPMFRQDEVAVVVLTSARGAARLTNLPAPVRVMVLCEQGPIDGGQIVAALQGLGRSDLILCEGGPHLFGSLVQARAVDELFLTVAPHLAGREGGIHRSALVEGVAFAPDHTVPLALVSVLESDGLLFLRYGLEAAESRR